MVIVSDLDWALALELDSVLVLVWVLVLLLRSSPILNDSALHPQ